ncbi:Hypothetical predicted protein [Lecanosticta acicola]|uniref:Uncharacterized protein n=1 Tax=Lecanosticta acicola TaxID=111012 RepID=A0AAI8YWZ0_9PEZI|nr:Hypothetical predicted protein [Lecanosticta acicola]
MDEDCLEDTIVVASDRRTTFVQESALANQPLYADLGQDEILDARIRIDGEFEYLVKRRGRQVHEWKWETRAAGELSDFLIDSWMEGMIHTAEQLGPDDDDDGISLPAGCVRIDLEGIVGEDEENYLIAWQRHPVSRAALRPFWFRKEETNVKLIEEWQVVLEWLEAALRTWIETYGDERGFLPEYELPRQGQFLGVLEKPVGRAVREFIEESYPRAWDEVPSDGGEEEEGDEEEMENDESDEGNDADDEDEYGDESDIYDETSEEDEDGRVGSSASLCGQ